MKTWTRRKFINRTSIFTAGAPLLGLSGCSDNQAQAIGEAPWHHLPDGTFRNPPGAPKGGMSFSKMLSHIASRFSDHSNQEPPPGHSLTTEQTLAGLAAHQQTDYLTWLGHSAFILRLGGKTVLFDPFLSEYATPVPPFGPKRFTPAPLQVNQLPPVDVLIVSHNHYDHLDKAVIEALPGRDNIQVIAPLNLGEFFRQRGYKKVQEMDWGQSVKVREMTITALPGYHFSRRGLADTNATLWAGFSLQSRGFKVYYSGDTAFGPLFKELGREYGPFDLGLVTIGAYHPREMFGASHASPEEAARMCLNLKLKKAVGMHWGVIRLTEEPPFEPGPRFAKAARSAGLPDEAILPMAIGQTIELVTT